MAPDWRHWSKEDAVKHWLDNGGDQWGATDFPMLRAARAQKSWG